MLRYKPYELLSDTGNYSIEDRLAHIESLIASESCDEAIFLASELLTVALEGVRYLQTYDWLFLRTIVTLGYLGWIAYSLTTVIDLHVLHGVSDSHRTFASTVFFSSILVALFSVLLYQGSSWRYYFYAAFPIFFWEQVFERRKALVAGRTVFLGNVHSFGGYLALAFNVLLFLGVLEALVRDVLAWYFFSWLTPCKGQILLSKRNIHHMFYIGSFLASRLRHCFRMSTSTFVSDVGSFLLSNEYLYSPSRDEGRRCRDHVSLGRTLS